MLYGAGVAGDDAFFLASGHDVTVIERQVCAGRETVLPTEADLVSTLTVCESWSPRKGCDCLGREALHVVSAAL